jgi:hypothetical protein
LKEHTENFAITAKYCFLLNTGSYVLCFFFLFNFTQFSLVASTTTVAKGAIDLSHDYTLIYIAANNEEIHKLNLQTNKTQLVEKIKSDSTYEKWNCYLAFNSSDPFSHNLVKYRDAATYANDQGTTISSIFSGKVATVTNRVSPRLVESNTFYDIPRIEKNSGWEYIVGHGVNNGFYCYNLKKKKSIKLAQDWLFAFWMISNPTEIEDGKIIFELDASNIGKQICLFDAYTKEIALIARGRSPLVIRANEEKRE